MNRDGEQKKIKQLFTAYQEMLWNGRRGHICIQFYSFIAVGLSSSGDWLVLHQYGIQWGFIWNKVERQFACDRGNQSRRNSMMELFTPVLIKMLRRGRPVLLCGKRKKMGGGKKSLPGRAVITSCDRKTFCFNVFLCMCNRVHVCVYKWVDGFTEFVF